MENIACSEEFHAAAAYVGSLAATRDLADDQLLKFYGLYKQATEGPCTFPKPSFLDLKGRSKWRAWSDLGEMSQEGASSQYVDLLSRLRPEWRVTNQSQSRGGAGGPVFSSLADSAQNANDAEHDQAQVPLICEAARIGNVGLLTELLQMSPGCADHRDPEGCTALHWAADRGHQACIDALLQHGADINACDHDGMTALHYAAVADQKGCFMQLRSAGADSSIRSVDGQTAEELIPETSWLIDSSNLYKNL